MYYKTKWRTDHSPFVCELSEKKHFPEVEVWVESQGVFDPIPYKVVDNLMYKICNSTFEGLAEGIASGLKLKIQVQGKVTVKVAEDPDFWVEVVEQTEPNDNSGKVTESHP